MNDIIELQGHYYIRANASIADGGTRVLKCADTFGIFDRHGDIRPLGFENQGIFSAGTRFVSRWKLGIGDTNPLLLSSNVREENDFLDVDLTNPTLPQNGSGAIAHGALHFGRMQFLWGGCFFERVAITNFAVERVSFVLQFEFAADYVDLFEVRGTPRSRRGQMRTPVVTSNQVQLGYDGLDAHRRETRIRFSLTPHQLSSERAIFKIELAPQERLHIDCEVECLDGEPPRKTAVLGQALDEVHVAYEDYRKHITVINTSNHRFNDWIQQSRADLHLLVTPTTEGPYPYAGIPWFSCIFGRDGIITALETLWGAPQIARGVLTYLAERQASEFIPAKDAEPGKILHEERKGEMAALGEVPFGDYYGSIDSTPLWLILVGRYYERTADRDFVARLWPNIERALTWIDQSGDCDGDGFVEYAQKAGNGLINQGWKDSGDSVFHADGKLATAPIALCEVQAYVFEAKQRAAQIAHVLGHADTAQKLRESAETLRSRFHDAFWCEDLGTYAIALDGEKRPCRVRSSNAGHCLLTGVAQPEAARRIKDGFLSDAFFSGWGIRTIASSEARYNPMSYHDGSIWPHDNALIAAGFARYGFKEAAVRVLDALFDASQFLENSRLPELYCGFNRQAGEGPILYPVACNPQAWSSAALFFALQACLGLRVEAATQRVVFENPRLPLCLNHVEILDLPVGAGLLDVILLRHEEEVAVNVRRRVGKIEVMVIH